MLLNQNMTCGIQCNSKKSRQMESVAMPRPTVVNAKRQPAPPLNVEELKFWLRIMEEHALFINSGLPSDNAGLISEAENYQQEFASLQAQAEGAQNERRFAELVAETRVLWKISSGLTDDWCIWLLRASSWAVTSLCC